MLRRVTKPEQMPVTLDTAKARLRIQDEDDARDSDLELLIEAAVGAVEQRTSLALTQAEWEATFDAWPSTSKPLKIDLFPIRDVLSLTYLDDEGNEQEVAADDWYWVETDYGAEIYTNVSYSQPALFDRSGSLRVRVSAGYDDPTITGISGSDPRLDFPAQAQMAVLFLVGHWYASREPVVVGSISQEIPATFEFLAQQLRIFT